MGVQSHPRQASPQWGSTNVCVCIVENSCQLDSYLKRF